MSGGKKPHWGYSVSWPRFEPETSRIQVRNFSHFVLNAVNTREEYCAVVTWFIAWNHNLVVTLLLKNWVIIMDLKSKSGQCSKYSDWLRDSTTLFPFLAVTYCFTSPPSIAVCKNAWSRTSTPAMHSWNRTRTALAYSMQVACGGTPCHLFCIREDADSNLCLENG